MKLASFSALTLLALVYAGLTLTEGVSYRAWQRTLDNQRDIQAKVAYFQHLKTLTEQLLKRMAVDSQRDPALLELLQRHQINVVVKPAEPMPVRTPEAPEKPAAVPAPATPAHP